MGDEPSCSKELCKSDKTVRNEVKDAGEIDLEASLARGQLNQKDLLKLLSCLEGELQARDVVIAALKAEKTKHLLQQARYGKLGLRDPFTALQRDSFAMVSGSTSGGSAGGGQTDIGHMYESQLTHLEKLIATQRKAHQRAKQVLAAAERRHARTVRELEEEKQKRANDAAQGDDVCMMLEKERERLQQEIDNLRIDHEKTEADLQKLRTTLEEEKERHKQIVLYLLQERRHFLLRMTEEKKSRRGNAVGVDTANVENTHHEVATTAVVTAPAEVERLKAEAEMYRIRYEEEHRKRVSLEAKMKSLEDELNMIRQTILAKSKQASVQEESSSRATATTATDNFTSGSKTVKLQRRSVGGGSGGDGNNNSNNHKQQQHGSSSQDRKVTPSTSYGPAVQSQVNSGSSHGSEVRYQILSRSAAQTLDAVTTRMPLPVNTNLSQSASATQHLNSSGLNASTGRFQNPGGQRTRYVPNVIDKSLTGNYSATAIFNQTSPPPPPPPAPNAAAAPMLPPPFNPGLMTALGNAAAAAGANYRLSVEQFSVYAPASMMAMRNTITIPPTQVHAAKRGTLGLAIRGAAAGGTEMNPASGSYQGSNAKFTANIPPSMVVRRPSSAAAVISPILPQPSIAPPSYSSAVHYSSMREHWGGYSGVAMTANFGDTRNVPSYRASSNGIERERVETPTTIHASETALAPPKVVENLTRKKQTSGGANKQDVRKHVPDGQQVLALLFGVVRGDVASVIGVTTLSADSVNGVAKDVEAVADCLVREIAIVGFIQVIGDQLNSDLSLIQHVLKVLRDDGEMDLAWSYAVAVVSSETIRGHQYDHISFTVVTSPDYAFQSENRLTLSWCSTADVLSATLSLRVRFRCDLDLYQEGEECKAEVTKDRVESQFSRLIRRFENGRLFFNAVGSRAILHDEVDPTDAGDKRSTSLFDLWKQLHEETGTKAKRRDLSFLTDVVDLRLLLDKVVMTDDDDNESQSVNCVPMVQCQMCSFTIFKIPMNVNVVYVSSVEESVKNVLPKLKRAIVHQLRLCRECFLKYSNLKGKRFVIPQPYLFKLAGQINGFVNVTYPSDMSEEDLIDERTILNALWNLPTDRVYFRQSSEYLFPHECSYIRDVHVYVGSSGIRRGFSCTVQGPYEYRHYLQDGFDDRGWGCAYRSLQTIWSWLLLGGYVSKPVPLHREIQQMLVNCGDKEENFIGSKQWIGSFEISYCLNHALNITSKFLSISHGSELDSKARQLVLHFENEGTPVMIGGGAFAYTIVGAHFDDTTGDARFLVLDPHYTGPEDVKTIVDKGWCGWKKSSFWQQDTFYNLLLPVRPRAV